MTEAKHLREKTLAAHQATEKGEMGIYLGDVLEGEMTGLSNRMNSREDRKESYPSSGQWLGWEEVCWTLIIRAT